MRPAINLSDLRYECPAVSRSAPTPSLKFYLLASFFLEQARKSQAHVATWTWIRPATILRVVCFPAATHPPSRLTQVLPMGTFFRTSTNESSSGWYLKINPPGNNLKASFVFGRPPPPRSYKVERKPEAHGYFSKHTRPADVDSTLYERGGVPARPQNKN